MTSWPFDSVQGLRAIRSEIWSRFSFNPLKPSGKYMYHLLHQSSPVQSVFMGLSLDVNSDYFLEQR
jgi:hypothetical protein